MTKFIVLTQGLVRPVEATSLPDEEKKLVFERDGGRCCLTGITFENHRAEGLVYLHIVPPTVFTSSPDLSEGVCVHVVTSLYSN